MGKGIYPGGVALTSGLRYSIGRLKSNTAIFKEIKVNKFSISQKCDNTLSGHHIYELF